MELTINELVGAITGGFITIGGVTMALKKLGWINFGKQVKDNCGVSKKDCKKDMAVVDEKLEKGETHFKDLDGKISKTAEDVSFIRGWIEGKSVGGQGKTT